MRCLIDLYMLYQFDNSILDGLQLPEAVDADTLKDNLLLESAERELIYTDPAFLKNAVTVWSRKQLPVWTELEKTLHYEYNPIENYNMEEKETPAEYTETTKPSGSTVQTTPAETTETTTPAGSKTTDTPASVKNVDENRQNVYGANSENPRPANSENGSQTVEVLKSGETVFEPVTDGTRRNTTQKPETVKTVFDNDEERHFKVNTERKLTRTGNIGVTTSQQMIEAQRELVKFNIMDVIIQDFIDRFCLLLY